MCHTAFATASRSYQAHTNLTELLTLVQPRTAMVKCATLLSRLQVALTKPFRASTDNSRRDKHQAMECANGKSGLNLALHYRA